MSNDNLPIPGGSKKPKNLHIAHRRSPSELTTLMVEQYNLQRQLDEVQAQQKQILQQQQLTQQQQRQFTYPPSEGGANSASGAGITVNTTAVPAGSSSPGQYRPTSHSRSSSINSSTPTGHRRTNSGAGAHNAAQGHNRRHSLGLNEAIKAAANQRQTNKSSLSPSTPSNPGPSDNDDNLG